MEMGHLTQYIDNNQMIFGVCMEILQGKESVYAKITMKRLMLHEADLYVTEQGRVKAVSIMATVRENLVSTDKGTTSQPLIKHFISVHGGILEQALRHRTHILGKHRAYSLM
jgi:hypothetical protein